MRFGGGFIMKYNREISNNKFMTEPDDEMIICRCEEITKGEIRLAIYNGMRTVNEVKRYLRAGMGLCQGQTCSKLVRRIIAKELGVPVNNVPFSTPRSPVRPLPMEVYAKDNNAFEEEKV